MNGSNNSDTLRKDGPAARMYWTVLRTALRDFRRLWRQLLVADVLAAIASSLVAVPLVTFVLRFLIRRSGSEALTDTDILYFALSPVGVVSLLGVAAATAAIGLARHAVAMTIGMGAIRQQRLTWYDALRFVFSRALPILGVAGRVLLALLFLALPFIAALWAVYALLLTEYDINYYLSSRPPDFLLAVGVAGVLLVVLLVLAVRLLLRWVLALPMVMFEGRGSRAALRSSAEATRGRLRWILLLFGGWFVLSWLIAAVATGIIGFAARLLVPEESVSLGLVALALAGVLVLTVVVDLVVAFVSAALLALINVHAHVQLTVPAEATEEAREAITLTDTGGKPGIYRKRVACGVLVAVGVILATLAYLLHWVSVPDHIQVTAHRGASSVAPENTLAAMRQAIADGADWVEIDVQETAGGLVVVHHDRDFMKTSGVDVTVWNSKEKDLREIDVGTWFAPEFSGERPATLGEVLRLCRDRIGVNIELKYYEHHQQLEELVVTAVEAADMQHQVVLMSLNAEGVGRARELRPDWTYGLLATVGLGDLTRLPVDFLALNAAAATRSLIRRAHSAGKKVHVWTVNDPILMSALISRGADNLITDRPATARRVLREREELSAVERLLVDIGSQVGVLSENARIEWDESDA